MKEIKEINGNSINLEFSISSDLSNVKKIVFCKNCNFLLKFENLLENAKLINFRDPVYSNCYNPFGLFRNDTEILEFANKIVDLNPEHGDTASIQATILSSIMFYLVKYRPKEEQNFVSILKMLRASDSHERHNINDPGHDKTPLERIFDEVEKRDPCSIALRQFQISWLMDTKNFDLCVAKLYAWLQFLALKDNTNAFNIINEILLDDSIIIVVLPENNLKINMLKELFYFQFGKLERTKSQTLEYYKRNIYFDNINDVEKEKIIENFDNEFVNFFDLKYEKKEYDPDEYGIVLKKWENSEKTLL